ncbi:Crp/Fnr family transcriptional regulator [Psychromarinibacter sp. C21-152]|uniref:Crp/Fnr family transcriptional regulator n=1 Tax=Psychromarinibacter sediminicola TaxID=3033385 RepID=A0AAE3T9P0_9RHOB|nr:Crp/Fnr family transcriptional regulator [Psychromarinibacter sediminicola]MDF0602437.1 Crp/Fnr family transcriptional regulator [Psychromarinibacter sediminicola]
MPTHTATGPQLCAACPLRRLGMRHATDIQPENGAIGALQLPSGRVLEAEALTDRFLMVRQGTLKVEYLNRDGHPEVAAFLFPGDPVISTFSEDPVAITALEDSWLCDLDPERINCAPNRAGAVMRELWHALGAQASSDQRRLILARTGSVEQRMRWFLSDLSRRQNCDTVELSMSRGDIAHYLETSAESVSRAISDLARKGVIVRERPRRIRVVD